MSTKIAVIVLNYKGLEDTLECIESLKRCTTKGIDLDIIVVDNNSDDGSVEALSKIKDIILLSNDANLGFAGGNNTGIKEALKRDDDLIIILNNDTYVDRQFIKEMAKAIIDADIISPKIYFAPGFEYHDKYNKEELGKVIWYAGGYIDWDNVIGHHIGVDEVDNGQYDRKKEIDLATGACFGASARVFENVGMFDEKYFLYLEEMDLCVRAKRAGFKLAFAPKAVIWHKNARSTGGSGSKLQDYYITRNRLLFAFKWAKIRTKFAVLRQVIGQAGSSVKRKALIDFLTFNFGKGDF